MSTHRFADAAPSARRRSGSTRRVLLVDLNNFARFPTLSVGLLAAVLRAHGHDVEVLSPLATGMRGLPRPQRAAPWGYWDERLRWWSATSSSRLARIARTKLSSLLRPDAAGRSTAFELEFRRALARRPDVVLVSAYLMYRELVTRLAAASGVAGVPFVVGGPAFHAAETRAAWRGAPGLTGIFAGEAEPHAEALVQALARGEHAPAVPGFTASSGPDVGLAPPLAQLDELPFPDYADFPWDRYPNRIVSVLAGRGCGWGVCRFCSDVVTVAGRGFRSRSVGSVLGELAHAHREYGVSLFCFSDLKLNSDLAVWRGLHERVQGVVPDARWTAAVHVGPRSDEGLSFDDLVAARRAGLMRVTTGLESGSQRLLDAMCKGTSISAVGEFLVMAKRAGISTRVTAFTGFPSERADDLHATTSFLEGLGASIDRVHLSRFLIQSDTPIDWSLTRGATTRPAFASFERVPADALVRHVDDAARDPSYQRALHALLKVVHRINRRELDASARAFEGAM